MNVQKPCECGSTDFVLIDGRTSYYDVDICVDGKFLKGMPEEDSDDEEDNCFDYMNEQTEIPEKAQVFGITNSSSGSYIAFSISICTQCRRVQL